MAKVSQIGGFLKMLLMGRSGGDNVPVTVDSSGHPQLDILTMPSLTIAFTTGTSNPVQIDPGDAAVVGVSSLASKEDHQHPVSSNILDKSAIETVSGLWTFSDQSCVIGGVTASNLVDKAAAETVTGVWSHTNGAVMGSGTDTVTFAAAAYFACIRAAVVNSWVTFKVNGDAALRGNIRVDGRYNIGDGTNPVDVILYRSAANILYTPDTFDAAGFKAGGTAGLASFGPAAPASITIKNGIVTACSA